MQSTDANTKQALLGVHLDHANGVATVERSLRDSHRLRSSMTDDLLQRAPWRDCRKEVNCYARRSASFSAPPEEDGEFVLLLHVSRAGLRLHISTKAMRRRSISRTISRAVLPKPKKFETCRLAVACFAMADKRRASSAARQLKLLCLSTLIKLLKSDIALQRGMPARHTKAAMITSLGTLVRYMTVSIRLPIRVTAVHRHQSTLRARASCLGRLQNRYSCDVSRCATTVLWGWRK